MSMMEFGASVIRLAEVARHSGRAAEAVNELWPLITGLETRIAAGQAEHQVLILLTQARAAFGIALGHLLPDEQLATAARWTGKALRIAQHIGDRQLLAYAGPSDSVLSSLAAASSSDSWYRPSAGGINPARVTLVVAKGLGSVG
jgi:hypothetical protein